MSRTDSNIMDLFVYDWAYDGYTVYGHCLDDNGKYVCIRFKDFFPSCYVEGDTVPRSTVVPHAAEFKRMLSSRDVSRLYPFHRLYFNNASDLASFSREHSYRCYMADIPQVATFLSQAGLDHVGWVSHCMKDITNIPDRIPPRTPRVMAFDIEVRSSDSGMPQPYRLKDSVEMVSVVMFGGGLPVEKYIMHTLRRPLCLDGGVTDITFNNEIGLIVGFFNLMKEADPTVVTGFNIYGFDMHYLVSRLKLRLIEIPPAYRVGTIDVIKVDWSSDAYGHNSYDRLVIGGRMIVDMYLYFKRMKLDKYSLDFVSSKFLGEGKNDMPYEKMADAFASGDHAALRTVAQYCVQDSVLVMKLFEKVQMWIDVCEIAKITRCGIEDIYTRGEQMKMVSQCVAECEKRNIVLQPQRPSDWKQYEGAYVLEPTKGVYDGCSIVDFQSLYPSIIIAYNICPSTYAKVGGTIRIGEHGFRASPIGLLPGMIKRILDERKQVKIQMKAITRDSVEYIVLDRRQNALKICANSVYGMMGFQSSRYFGHLGCAESVTTAGRLLLSDTVTKINDNYSVKVIYGDTDSCMLWHDDEGDETHRTHVAKRICDEVTALLPEPMALQFETYCDKVILLTKKRYILVTGNRVSYKGVMNARRDYCKYAKDTYSQALELVAKGAEHDAISDYIDKRILRLLHGRVDPSDLVVTKSIAKRLNAYKVNQPHVVLAKRLVKETGIDIPAGTRLEYVYVKNADMRMVTPDELDTGSFEVDGKFYVEKQLATQIDDVLSAIGMGNYIKGEWLT